MTSETPPPESPGPLARLAAFWRRHWLVRAGALVLAAGVVALGAGLAGYVAAERDIPEKLMARLRPALHAGDDTQTIAWRVANTNLHQLQIAEVTVNTDPTTGIWALASVGDNILFASRLGRFGYLDAQNRLKPLALRTPMGLDALRASGLMDDPIFQISEVRTVDLLTVPAGDNRYDLYASHHRYRAEGRCFEFVVSRTRLETGPEGVRVAQPDWEDIYIARPCIEIKDRGMRFAGHEGAGRLALLNPTTLLFSVGVFQFDGIAGDRIAGMDPETDLGKIIAIDLTTRRGRIHAQGMRNPQGLLVARDGRVWETEHGPQGGDEVNLVRAGGNYGWPTVTYGMDYGSPPRNWPYNPVTGSHDGYERPRFAFVPSIGISQIIQPDPREFPNWERHLIAASLRGGALFSLRVEGDDIVYAEPIPFDGARLRDLITLPDGRIAALKESGVLFLIRNGERHADETAPLIVAGLASLAMTAPEDRLGADTPALIGARTFFYACGSCHSLEGEIGAGPPLNGVFGRPVGAAAGFGYSPALSGHGGRWNERLLREFLNDPQRDFAGTTMPRVQLEAYQMGPLLRHLRDARADARPAAEKQ